jgi:tRNA(Ile)-lysidine synthase
MSEENKFLKNEDSVFSFLPLLNIKSEDIERPAVVAVSGGVDSMCLLHFLLSKGFRNLVVAHVDHGWRDSSYEDALFVEAHSKKFNLPCYLLNLKDKNIPHTEAAAREARIQFFQDVAYQVGAETVWLGHHADDLVETMLFQLFRGSSLSGLTALQEISGYKNSSILCRRPFLSVTKSALIVYAKEYQIEFREDITNQYPDYARNRVRNELLPLVKDIMQREVTPQLLQFYQTALHENDFMSIEVKDWIKKNLVLEKNDSVFNITEEFKCLHVALQLRVLRYWLVDFLRLTGINANHLNQVLKISLERQPSRHNLPDNVMVIRKNKKLSVIRNKYEQ